MVIFCSTSNTFFLNALIVECSTGLGHRVEHHPSEGTRHVVGVSAQLSAGRQRVELDLADVVNVGGRVDERVGVDCHHHHKLVQPISLK